MIWRDLSEVPANFGPAAVTIGNFDGAHAGHRHVMRLLVDVARRHGLTPVVLTFDPHPTKLVAPERAPRLLTTVEQRCDLIQAEGIDDILVLPFSAEVARLTPEGFVREMLREKLHARLVLVGENFRFGHRAAGHSDTLRELGARFGFETEFVAGVRRRGQIVSSSEIRRLVEAGQVSLACRMLERPYALEGRVVKGEGVGSKQTVPTLNLDTAAEVLPARGVYITRTMELSTDRRWESITNVGYRPTFGGERLTIETFLLAPALVGESPERIRVEFLRRVREERKFESAELLRAQILRDVSRATAYFRRLARGRH